MLEIWRAGGSTTGFSPEAARATEAEGWDGQMFMDSQCLSPDPYVLMGAWAGATSHLKLSTGVTNPVTRNLAVTAAGALAVHVLSGGRAVLGIGRGDSALAYLGLAPAGLGTFERALHALQALLRGEEIPFGDSGAVSNGAPSAHTLSLGARPDGVKLGWKPAALPKVPLDVAATGARVIAMSAPVAERVTFSVGADPERIGWALGIARAARAAAGLGDEGIAYGAQLVVCCHPDEAIARELAMRMAPPLARFQVMQGATSAPSAAADASSYEALSTSYDMTKHGGVHEENRLTSGGLTSDFVARFAIAGTPDYCLERLRGLRELGLERFVVVGPGFYPEIWGDARHSFAREVLPALK